MDFVPKCFFVSATELFSSCLEKVVRFLENEEDSFIELKKDGKFLARKKLGRRKLKKIMWAFFEEICERIILESFLTYSKDENVKFIVAETGNERRLSLELREKDIEFGQKDVLDLCEDWFLERFSKKKKERNGWIWCKHRLLREEDWKEVCRKKVFGKNNFAEWKNSGKEKKHLEEKTLDEVVEKISKEEKKILLEEAIGWIEDNL